MGLVQAEGSGEGRTGLQEALVARVTTPKKDHTGRLKGNVSN